MRYKNALIPGGIVSAMLLLFAFLLFYMLNIAKESTFSFHIDAHIYTLLKFTLFQAFLSTLISVVVGVLLAWSLAHQSNFKGRSILVALISSSLVLPSLVVVFGLISIYGRNGWINQLGELLFDHSFGTYLYGLLGILLAHVYLNASFAARGVLHALESIPDEKYKVAKSLNFSLYRRFIYVEWPAIKSTLLGAASTIFLLCFTSFAIVLVLGGSPSYNTLEVAIYEAVKIDYDIAMALKLALIQLAISTFLVMTSSSFTMNVNTIQSSKGIHRKETKAISSIQSILIVLFSLFFITPMLATIFDGIGADFVKIFSDPLFQKSFLTSVSIATISAVLSVLFALLISDTQRTLSLKGRAGKERVGSRCCFKWLSLLVSFSGNLYLAIPSLVLGLGFFLLSQQYVLPENVWPLIALLVANILISLPFALSVFNPMMQKTALRYDKLVSSLNIGYIQRWKEIELPYLLPSIAYVFALSFCFSFGDLGIISLFGSQDFSTLPWYLYGLLGSYRTNDAAGVALILLALTLLVFMGIPKLFRRDNA